jgi:hypothetical protein
MHPDDIPYEPIARDRAAEGARCESEIPGYAEARRHHPTWSEVKARAAVVQRFVSGQWGVDLDTFESDQQRELSRELEGLL